ncbi:MAG TPA: amidohydrolase, partial [Alteromonas macleodii]|nr:amidohydrolase [Alteromonas macleodii]
MQKRLTRLLSGLAITLAVSLSASFTGYAATLVTDVTGYTLNSQGEMVTFNKILFAEGKVLQLNPSHVP